MTIVQGILKVPATTEGKKPKEKRIELTPGKHNYNLYIAIMAVLMAVIVVAGIYFAFAGQTPVKTATDPPEVKTAEVLATEQTAVLANTDLLKKLEADKKDPVLAQRIARWPMLIPINNIPNKIKISPQYEVYIVGLTMGSDNKLRGSIVNNDMAAVSISSGEFQYASFDYGMYGGAGTDTINNLVAAGVNWDFAPGTKKEFVTRDINNPNVKRENIGFIVPRHIVEKI